MREVQLLNSIRLRLLAKQLSRSKKAAPADRARRGGLAVDGSARGYGRKAVLLSAFFAYFARPSYRAAEDSKSNQVLVRVTFSFVIISDL